MEKLEKTMSQLVGYPFKYKSLSAMTFYPLYLGALNLVIVQRIFNYHDDKFEEIGRVSSRLPLAIRLYMKYLTSMENLIKQAPKMWKMYFSVGELKVIESDTDRGRTVLRVENFKAHPLHCQILRGYFPSLAEMMIKERVECRETKCIYRGDEYHEFVLQWR